MNFRGRRRRQRGLRAHGGVALAAGHTAAQPEELRQAPSAQVPGPADHRLLPRDGAEHRLDQRGVHDLRGRHLPGAELARLAPPASREHVRGVPHPRRRLAAQHLAARLLLQERQEGHLPRDVHTQPLPLALPRQDAALHVQAHARALLRHEVRVLPARHADLLDDDRESVAHHAGPRVHLEPDRSAGRQPRDRAAAARHRQQLHHRLHHRVLHRQLHLHPDCVQPAAPPRLPPLPHLHTLGPHRRHVVDRLLDQARGDTRAGHPRRHLPPDPRHPEHPVAAARLLRQGHRRLDVLVQRLRLPVAHGVRRGQQLHGAGGHQGDEGLLRRGPPRGHRRVQDADQGSSGRLGAQRQPLQEPGSPVAPVRHLLRGSRHCHLHRQTLALSLPLRLSHSQRRLLEHLPLIRRARLTLLQQQDSSPPIGVQRIERLLFAYLDLLGSDFGGAGAS